MERESKKKFAQVIKILLSPDDDADVDAMVIMIRFLHEFYQLPSIHITVF